MSPSSFHRVLGRLLFAISAGSAATGCGAKTTGGSEQEEDDLQGASGATSATVGEEGPSTGEVAAQCSGGRASTFCLDTNTMRQQARLGAGQIAYDLPRSEEEVAAGFESNGCMRYDWVASSCCNPALGPGKPKGSNECCYQTCDSSCCGRPLVLGDRTLVSEAQRRNDWLVADTTLTGLPYAARPDLTPAERARLVELWQADALMEHASIASFARFGLQLLALGAPAQLVRDTQLAALDEIRHAENAFSIASRLAGRAIGPGKLPELDSPLDTELCAVSTATLVEGCIGETLAAVVAQEQARHAGDQATRQALLEVAEDELRHAQLAFRFIVWSLARGGEELRHTLRREVDQRLARLPEPSSTSAVSTTVLHHYGRLTADEQRALYRQAREQILRPAFSALLEPGLAQLNRTNSAESAC